MPTRNTPDEKKSSTQIGESLDFVYQVAERAWKKGLSANFIAKDLGHAGDPKMIMAVKRALRKAIDDGILVLNVPREDQLRDQLQRKWSRVDFTIVRNNLVAPGDAVHIAASDELADKIEKLWNTDKKTIVIANAGGHAVSETVRYLHQKHRPVLNAAVEKRLVFISLNSAGRARKFQQSSNYLAVRLAEIYEGDHITMLGPTDTNTVTDKEYKHLIENIDLLLCGAGGPDSLLAECAKEEGISLPSEMLGDLAFIPLDANGRRVHEPRLQAIIEKKLHTAPAYDEILRITTHPPRAVMVVLSGASKREIASALLRGGLASHLVLDLRLAQYLVDLCTR